MQVFTGVIFLLLLSGLACNLPDSTARISSRDTVSIDSIINRSEWVFEKAEDRSLYFTNGKAFNTHLYDLRYIGQVHRKEMAPNLIFSGRYCNNCDEPVSIYVHSPSDGDLVVAMGKNGYAYPGEEKDSATGNLVYQARVFYGQVLNKTEGVIWYQKKITPTRNWQTDIYLIDLTNNTRKEGVVKENGQLKQTLALYSADKCTEIKGMERSGY